MNVGPSRTVLSSCQHRKLRMLGSLTGRAQRLSSWWCVKLRLYSGRYDRVEDLLQSSIFRRRPVLSINRL